MNRANLALFTCILAFVVILLGAYTRLTNAGLSCPDWPNCYGYLTAPHTATQLQEAASRYPATRIDIKGAWTEMTHRYLAGTEGILILVLSYSLLFGKAAGRRAKILALSLVLLLCSQVMLGMLTVTEKLKPIIVLGHLLNGLSLLSLLWWTYLTEKKQTTTATTRIIPWLWLGLCIVIAQITLGGWVSTHYAGLACIDLPYCNGKVLPPMQWGQLNSDLITIHMLHRFGALITACYLVFIAIWLGRMTAFKKVSTLILSLITLQLILGILNIIWLRPVWIAMLHHATAAILLLTMIMILIKTHQRTEENTHG